MKEQRYCANCRAPLPRGAAWCEACGTDAPVIFDGRLPGARSSRSGRLVVLLIVVAVAAGGWYFRDRIPIRALHGGLPRTDTGPIRVVGQRPGGARRAPGAKINEPEAVMTLRRHVAPLMNVKTECVSTVSRGSKGDEYIFDVVDSCKGTKLGRWRVDGRTGEVRR